MAVIEADIPSTRELRSAPKGPVTTARHRRNVMVYGALCVLAFLPWLTGATWSWRALGLGLMLPGGGFAALGGWWLMLLPVTLFLFYLSFIAWFWAGIVVAPLTVWLGSALLAGGLAGDDGMHSAVWLVPLIATGIFIYFWQKDDTRRVADRARHGDRQKFFAGSLQEVIANIAAEPASAERELSQEQLHVVRHLLDRALQPIEEFKGFTIIDQFQPAALRYQLNHLGYALGMVQGHYTPNFSGYLGQAQRNLIDKYLLKRVWDYWVLESMWGHFNFTDFDPAAKDNIMLTGYFGMHVNQYMLNSGDRRYAEPGSLTFRLNARTAYRHDAHTLVDSVRENHKHSDFCLFPCEPNWVYPVCNMYGMSALASHDRVFGTQYTANVLPRWMEMLNTEFTDGKGSLIGLRSYWTGIEIPFYAGEAGFAFFANIFSPTLGQRLWAIGRKELSFCLAPDGEGGTRLSIPAEALSFLDTIDPGHYRKGSLFAYAAVAMSAREFGDDELADAALRSMDLDCGRSVENGALSYAKGSELANIWAMEAKLMRTSDFRNSFVHGPSEKTLQGPLLESAEYPAVLVAKAYSNGEDLNLVLYAGNGDTKPQRLQLARLVPGKRYTAANNPDITCVADSEGKATIAVSLSERTELRLVPVT